MSKEILDDVQFFSGYKMPKTKIEVLKECFGDIGACHVDVTDLFMKELIQIFNENVEIWPENTTDGISFYATPSDDLFHNDNLNTKSKMFSLKDIIYTYYICDDDSYFVDAEKLGVELKELSEKLLESAERGKKKWGKESRK